MKKILIVIFLIYANLGLSKPIDEVIPVTMGNIKGQKNLYNNGWYVISSTKNALSFAYEHSIENSNQAILRMSQDLSRESTNLSKDIINQPKKSYELSKKVLKGGSKVSKKLVLGSHKVAKQTAGFANKSFVNSWDSIVSGGVYLVDRSPEDFKIMMRYYGDYFSDLKNDFSNLDESLDKIFAIKKDERNKVWDQAFKKASFEFKKEVKKSSESSNTLTALPRVLWGNIKALYYGVVKPSAESSGEVTAKATKKTFKYISYPLAGSFILAGRTAYNIGGSAFYATKIGYNILSPTIEAGFFAGLGLLSTMAIPVEYAGGASLGIINQVGVTAATPVVGATHYAMATTMDVVSHSAVMLYDVAKGSSVVAYNQVSSGVVLGYNALTAIPAQALLGITNGAVFLAWDSHRLIIAYAKGEVGELPVGSVIDMEKLKKKKIKVKTLSRDPKVIKKVLENMPKDLKVK